MPPALLHSEQQLSVALTDLVANWQGQVDDAQRAIKELEAQALFSTLFEPIMVSMWPQGQQDTMQCVHTLRQEMLENLLDSSNSLQALVEKMQKCQKDLADLPNRHATCA